jgi:2-oxoglutarate/2-oxoacid ferredoxin oxidoreductase subunit alpha
MAEKNIKLLQGNEACVEGALAAGLQFFAGYPITPSTELAELCALNLPKIGGKFVQMEDEIAGMAATIGGSLAGLKSMTATSGPGFSLKQENLGFAIMAEVPCVIVNVMRGGPSTGLPTATAQGDVMQARWGTHGDHPIIALAPYSVPDAYHTTIRAFNLAEKYSTPVVVLLDEVIGHMREAIEIPEKVEGIIERKNPEVAPEEYLPYKADADKAPKLARFGSGYPYHVTGLAHDFTGFPTTDINKVQYLMDRLRDKIELHKDDIVEVEEIEMADADVMIVAYGSVSRVAANAMRSARAEGKKVGLLRLKTIWPFADKYIEKYKDQVKAVIVPEQNQGQLVYEVERLINGKAPVFAENRYDGELMKPVQILNCIKEVYKNA